MWNHYAFPEGIYESSDLAIDFSTLDLINLILFLNI